MNTVLQRTGPRVGLVCTEGFRDVLYFRHGFKPDRFNLHLRHPLALVDRWLCVGINERMDAHGQIVRPLDEDSVRRAAEHFAQAGVEAIAVALLWAPANAAHERRAAQIIREELPDIPVIEATEVLPEIREWERTSAAVLSAYLLPEMKRYLHRLEGELQGMGFKGSLLVMQTNGGCASVSEILRRSVYSLASGPAAAPAAALHVAAPEMRDLLITDLGGTSFDVSLITGGKPRLSRTMQIEGQPTGIPGVAVHSVGAGGGSIAWVDSGGVLQVGPLSGGARPGPACYGQGGTRATVTDAYVALGFLAKKAFLGGRRLLHEHLALEAIERDVARPLGLEPVVAADGIKRVVEAHMVAAIQAMSIKRGIDPRKYTVVVGGGAGGLHASRLARQFGIRRVLVPAEAPVLCALGMTVADVQHDDVRLLPMSALEADLGVIDQLFAEMEANASERLRTEGFAEVDIRMERSVDARYHGQIYELTVPLSNESPLPASTLVEVCNAFHERHRVLYGYERTDLPVEVLHWRLTARGCISRRSRDLARTTAAAARGRPIGPAEQRLVYFGELGGWILTDIYTESQLQPGNEVRGPAIIQAPATTVLLSAGDHVLVQADGSYFLHVSGEREHSSTAAGRELSTD